VADGVEEEMEKEANVAAAQGPSSPAEAAGSRAVVAHSQLGNEHWRPHVLATTVLIGGDLQKEGSGQMLPLSSIGPSHR
jgi:hypothetical protein